MTIIRKASAGLVLVGVLMVAAGAHALSAADRCESSKLKTSAKYGFCRLKEDANAVKSGGAPDFSKCDAKFSDKLGRAETSAMGQCPSNGDAATVQAFIAQCTDDVATLLAGGSLSSCASDLAACNSSLTTCTNDLNSCDSNLITCNNDLGAAQGNLATCNGDLGTCNGNLTTCNNDLSAAQGNLATCNGDLSTCNGDLGTCNGNLGTCNGNLSTCNSNLTTCSNDLGTAQSDLATCNGNLGTCNGDLSTAQSDLATCNNDLSTSQSDLTTCNSTLTTCQNDLATCQAEPDGQRVKTGQTTCYNATGTVIACAGTGQDGELQNGLAPSYVDNGDGTVTDTRTGLMWEKLSDDGSIHDKDTTYTWVNAFTKIASLNTASFAGYTDWRLPNVNELQSLASYGTFNPAVNAAFNTGCVASCVLTACSCTATSLNTWTSTTYHGSAGTAWRVRFFGGGLDTDVKSVANYVRAVRLGP